LDWAGKTFSTIAYLSGCGSFLTRGEAMPEPDEDERKLEEQVARVKPGFAPVRKSPRAKDEPATHVNAGTPDTAVLRAKSEKLRDVSSDSTSTDALRAKFLPDLNTANQASDSAPGRDATKPSAPEVKGRPRIVTIRPTRDADSDEGIPPKDIQLVMDDEGAIGESS
jgi:hypothetical protein